MHINHLFKTRFNGNRVKFKPRLNQKLKILFSFFIFFMRQNFNAITKKTVGLKQNDLNLLYKHFNLNQKKQRYFVSRPGVLKGLV